MYQPLLKLDIASLSKGKLGATTQTKSAVDLEQYLQRKDRRMPPISVPDKVPQVSARREGEIRGETVYDKYYRLLGKLSLNGLKPEEYIGVLDLLMARQGPMKTVKGEDYIKPSDLQRIHDADDLLCRYMTGGESVNSVVSTAIEQEGAYPKIVDAMRGKITNLESSPQLMKQLRERLDREATNTCTLVRLAEMKRTLEREYYFDPTQGETLDAHLRKVRVAPGIEATATKTKDGMYVIKKSLRLPFKYTLEHAGKAEDMHESVYRRLDNLLQGLSGKST